MPNDYFNNVPGSMYNNPYGGPYNAPGASFSYLGMNGYQPRNYGPYGPNIGQQNNALNGIQPNGGQSGQQPNMSNVNWIYVPNLEAAKNVSIMPSQTLYIMNQNKNEFYLKTSNEMGVSSLKVCPFSVFDVADYEQKSQIEQAQSVAGEFVGRDEFNNFAQTVSQQFAMIQQGMVGAATVAASPQPVTSAPVAPVQPVSQPIATEQPIIQQTVATPPATTKKGRKND